MEKQFLSIDTGLVVRQKIRAQECVAKAVYFVVDKKERGEVAVRARDNL
jgi:hypothetical protein